jgi:CDP-6-deoxy-D-xylo-4-hexulose-3-dehydrase
MEIQAAIGLVQLRYLDEMNERRNANHVRFTHQTVGLRLNHPRAPINGHSSWFGIPLYIPLDAPYTRDDYCAYLEANGVETRPILGGNLARQPVAKTGYFETGSFPGADYIHDQGFFLGLHPRTSDEIDRLTSIMWAHPTA